MLHPMSKKKILELIKIFSEYDFSNGYSPSDSLRLFKQYIPIQDLIYLGIVNELVYKFGIKYEFNSSCLDNIGETVSSIILKIETANRKSL